MKRLTSFCTVASYPAVQLTVSVAVNVVLYTESRHAMQIIQWKVIF